MIARRRGVHVVNLVRRDESVAELTALGIGNVVSTAAPDWKDRVRAIVGDAAITAAVDGVGGGSAGDLMSLLGEGGTFVSFGVMSGHPLQLSAGDLIFKQAVVKGFWLAKIMRTTPRETIARWIGELVGLVADGTIRLQVGGVYPFSGIAAAAQASAEPGRPGKILLKP
jgi:NADPH:quinone reductase-like Zn-dependent oxidoreductase